MHSDAAESGIDSREAVSEAAGKTSRPPPSIGKFRSFRGIDKCYCFFRDGHVQKIRLLDVLPHGEHDERGASSVRYVTCNVLPSMRKDHIDAVWICCTVPGNADTSTDDCAASCVLPAGLAGSCNHVAALMYALEDFVRQGLREEAAKT